MKDKMKLGRRDFLKSMGLTGAAYGYPVSSA